MPRGLNDLNLIGHIGRVDDLRFFQDGGCVLSASLATEEQYKNRSTGQKQKDVQWHRLVFKNSLAENAKEYLKKGSKAYIKGAIKYRKYTDKNTQVEMTVAEVHVKHFINLERAPEVNNPQFEPVDGINAPGDLQSAPSFDPFNDDIEF